MPHIVNAWTSLAMRRSAVLLVLGAALGLSGCATTQHAAALRPTGDPIADGRSAISSGPAKDRVLWQYRTALEALRRGTYEEAKTLLDDALLSIGSISAKDKEAKRSRGFFSEESRKTFRGEPYERVMAYYYRGILYWMDGEIDNARACFRSAQLQDSDTENKEYSSDYVLLDYLDGFAMAKLGNDGSDAFKRAQALNKTGPLPPYDLKANTFFFVECGSGPTKFATGEYQEQLRFHPGGSAAHSALIKIDGQTISLRPNDDLNFQATTRGGRIMDHVLANKAVFKSAADTAGNAALISGAVVAQNRHNQEAALGLLAFGLVSKIVSATTTPAADTRSWNNLPQYLGFTAVQLPAGQHTVTIDFLDASGQPLPTLKKTATVNVSATRDTVVFVSDKSHTTKTT
jgi:hypothetical protein